VRIDSIKFDEHEEDSLPSEITVTMSIMEAAQISCLFGEMSDKSVADRGWLKTNIYDKLTDVFNAYWDDGVSGAMSSHREARG
jgi:hypothetical protein